MQAAIPQSEASAIAQFMGLPGWANVSDMDLVDRVRTGLPLSTVTTIVRRIDPDGQLLHPTDLIPKSTFHKTKAAGRALSRDQSEKVFALSKVFSRTLRRYHGDADRASLFLSRKHPLLNGRSPFSVANESTAGADMVLAMLDRADAGVAV